MAESVGWVQEHPLLAVEDSIASSLLTPQHTSLEVSLSPAAFPSESVDSQLLLEHGDVPSILPLLLDTAPAQSANHGAGQLVADYLTSLADPALSADAFAAVTDVTDAFANHDASSLDHLIATFLDVHAPLAVDDGGVLDEGLGSIVGDVFGLALHDHPAVDGLTDSVGESGLPVDDISSDPFPDINLHGVEAFVGAHSSFNAGHAALG